MRQSLSTSLSLVSREVRILAHNVPVTIWKPGFARTRRETYSPPRHLAEFKECKEGRNGRKIKRGTGRIGRDGVAKDVKFRPSFQKSVLMNFMHCRTVAHNFTTSFYCRNYMKAP